MISILQDGKLQVFDSDKIMDHLVKRYIIKQKENDHKCSQFQDKDFTGYLPKLSYLFDNANSLQQFLDEHGYIHKSKLKEHNA